MKKNKKVLIISGISILTIAILSIIYVVLTTPDQDTTLTTIEKRYVSKNKNTVINIAVPNDVPVFSLNGEGIFFDFINKFSKDVELNLNEVSYNIGEEPSLYDYKFEITNNVDKNQILVYQDYYVALATQNEKLQNLSELNKMSIGCLKDKLSNITYYLDGIDASFVSKDSVDELLKGLEKNEYDTIIIPYMMYLDTILSNKYNIIYNFNDLKDNYVLTLSENNNTVNTIIKKYLELWKQNDYITSYNNAYKSLYYLAKEIKSKDQAELVGKVYNYGYIDNLPFEKVVNKKLVGINGEYINSFAKLTDSEFKFKRYNSISDLIEAFNENEVDIIFNNFNSNNTLKDAYQTVSTYKENFVILTNIKNNIVMDSVKSLKDKTVYALEDSDLATYIKINTEANLKTFKNYNVLLNNLKDDMLVIMDYDIYNYYKNIELKDYYVVYSDTFDNSYNFIIKNSNSNNTLLQIFNDFISSQNFDYIKTSAYQNIITNPKNETLTQTILNYFLFIVLPLIIIIILLSILYKKKKQINTIKKDEKLRYIDMLTSLKNRNYLNANIDSWDSAKVYPQTVIIIDLNNIKYINDNFGHEEGDNVIKASANILIKTQLENSEIIRTDGNEFLIYLIGYKEDQIVSYMRKLYKAMKDLPHGYGAAFGYSMINDEMKLLDDAINEATLDMRSNKES